MCSWETATVTSPGPNLTKGEAYFTQFKQSNNQLDKPEFTGSSPIACKEEEEGRQVSTIFLFKL